MASPGPNTNVRKERKDESLFEKLGTIGRKKKGKEATEISEEGKQAIDHPSSPVVPYLGPDGMHLEDNEERSIIDPESKDHPKLLELQKMLVDWVNNVLAPHRIIVQDLREDLYDGLILQKLFETQSNEIIREMPEVIQSEMGQKQKLERVIARINQRMQIPDNSAKWNVNTIHSKELVPILHLLVAMARHFRAPVRLPENCTVTMLVVQKKEGGVLATRKTVENITTTNDDIGARYERDAFDTLLDHAPDKLSVVKRSLITFVNKHLNKINLEVTDLDTQFNDGVYLVLLMGLLEGYFVPLYHFFPTPDSYDQKIHNVNFAFELMEDAGLARPKARADDVVNADLKCTLRVLYGLFTRYKANA